MKNMYYGNLGNLLSETRDSKNLTLEEVSRGCNVSKTYLQFIEHGHLYQLPSYTHARSFVKKYAEFLGFNYKKDVEYLFNSECQRDAFDTKNMSNTPATSTFPPKGKAASYSSDEKETIKKPKLTKGEKQQKKKKTSTPKTPASATPSFDNSNSSPNSSNTGGQADNINNNENVLSYINFKDMPDTPYDYTTGGQKNNTLLYIVIAGVLVLTVVVATLALWNKKTDNINPVFIQETTPDIVDDTPELMNVNGDAPLPYNYLSASSLGVAPTLNTYYIELIDGDLVNANTNQFRSLPINADITPPNVTYTDATPTIITPMQQESKTAYLRFTGESWIEVASDAGDSFDLIGNNGDTIPFTFYSSFIITIGNIAGAYLEYDGKQVTATGDEGQLLRNKVFTFNPETEEFAVTNKPRN